MEKGVEIFGSQLSMTWPGFAWAFNSRTPWALKGYRCKGWSSPLTKGRRGGQEGNAEILFFNMLGHRGLMEGLKKGRTVGAKLNERGVAEERANCRGLAICKHMQEKSLREEKTGDWEMRKCIREYERTEVRERGRGSRGRESRN